jgi:ribosomal protein S13
MPAPSFKPQLTTTQWLELPHEIRMRLKAVFGIMQSRPTEVVNNTVVSDGHSHGDLAKINVESMQKFLKSDETEFFKLLDETMNRIYADHEAELEAKFDKENDKRVRLKEEKVKAMKEMAKEMQDLVDDVSADVPKKRGRPKKQEA